MDAKISDVFPRPKSYGAPGYVKHLNKMMSTNRIRPPITIKLVADISFSDFLMQNGRTTNAALRIAMHLTSLSLYPGIDVCIISPSIMK